MRESQSVRRPSYAAIGAVCVISLPLAGCAWSSHDNNFARKTVFDEVVNARLSAAADHAPEAPPRRRRKATLMSRGMLAPTLQPAEFTGTGAADRIVTGSTKRRARGNLPNKELRQSHGGGYELNFKDADLSEVARIVLLDTLKRPYIYDPKVTGKVTFSTGRSVSEEELLDILEAILQMNRAALVKSNGQYQIVPAAEIKARSNLNVDYAYEAAQVGAGYGLSIVPLRHASSVMVLKLLQPFTGERKTVNAISTGNLIFIRGGAQERRTLMEVATSFDVDWLGQQSVGIYPLHSATPVEMVEELEQLFRAKKGQIGNGTIRFRPIDRLNAVLVISDEENLMRRAGRWVKRLDRSNQAGKDVHFYQLQHAKAVEVAKLLNETFGGGSSSQSVRSASDEVDPASDATRVESSDDEDSSSDESSSSSSEDTSDSTGFSGGTSSAGLVRVVPDKKKNALIIRAKGRDYRKVVSVIEELDQPPAQVLINATLAEVTLNDNIRFGVQAFLQESGQGAFGFSGNTNSLTIQPSFPGLNLIGGSTATPKVVLDALSQKTSVRVVSSPSVVAVNNEVASLQVGDEVPITTRQATSVTDPAAPIVNNIEFRETGVILKVKPTINRRGEVSMVITQEVSNVTNQSETENSSTLTPTISQKKISSTINIRSGQMVVLGGLISETQNDTRSRVPLWEHIPLLGNIPGRSDGGIRRTELVVFIRPTVIRNSDDALDVAHELQDRLRSLAPTHSQFSYNPPRKKPVFRN